MAASILSKESALAFGSLFYVMAEPVLRARWAS
jgi:hypothetical protein